MTRDLLITRGAILVPPHRYILTRDLHRAGRSAAICGVNPSRADASIDDHSVRKLYGFAERNDIGRFALVNEFAFQATDVRDLRTAADPIGPENDAWIARAFEANDIVIAMWGPLTKLPRPLRQRWRAVVAIAAACGKPVWCFGTAGDGHPLHVLTLGYAAKLQPWSAPA